MIFHELSTGIDMNATPEVVWQILTDFERYPAWNPFITSISGELSLDARLQVEISPPDSRAMKFRPRIVVLEPGRQLGWLGRVGPPGLFDGLHTFTIEPLGQQACHVHHCERFTGMLVPLLKRQLDTHTHAGFIAMNEALRTQSERHPSR